MPRRMRHRMCKHSLDGLSLWQWRIAKEPYRLRCCCCSWRPELQQQPDGWWWWWWWPDRISCWCQESIDRRRTQLELAPAGRSVGGPSVRRAHARRIDSIGPTRQCSISHRGHERHISPSGHFPSNIFPSQIALISWNIVNDAFRSICL